MRMRERVERKLRCRGKWAWTRHYLFEYTHREKEDNHRGMRTTCHVDVHVALIMLHCLCYPLYRQVLYQYYTACTSYTTYSVSPIETSDSLNATLAVWFGVTSTHWMCCPSCVLYTTRHTMCLSSMRWEERKTLRHISPYLIVYIILFLRLVHWWGFGGIKFH